MQPQIERFNAVKCNRGVVQLASILAWGASGRPFESGHSDKKAAEISAAFFVSKSFNDNLLRPDILPINQAQDIHTRDKVES